MKKRIRKCMALTIVTGMTAGLAACGGGGNITSSEPQGSTAADNKESTLPASSEVAPADASVTYPIAGAEKLTFGMALANEWSDRFDSWTDLPIGTAVQEKTGVELEMIHVADNKAMNLLLASPDLPDIILFNFQNNYSGGEIKAIEDGVIFPMDAEFLQQNAPDYWEVLNSDENIMKGSTNQQNQVFGFTFIMGCRYSGRTGRRLSMNFQRA